MRTMFLGILLLVAGLMAGCGSNGDDVQSGGEPPAVESFYDYVAISPYPVAMEGGSSQVLILTHRSLHDANITKRIDVALYSSDPAAMSVSPSACVLAPDHTECRVHLNTVNAWQESVGGAAVHKYADLIAEFDGKRETVSSFEIVSVSPLQKSVTFVNHCAFPVWLEFTGSNAAAIACTPSAKNAQSNCPSGWVCFENKTDNANYCVEGTAKTTTYPVTSLSDINLSTACNHVASDLRGAGQCTCRTDQDCAANQKCQTAYSDKGKPVYSQCYYNTNGGMLSDNDQNGSRTFTWHPDFNTSSIFSGNWWVKTGCEEDNGSKCKTDKSQVNYPTSVFEFTFAKQNIDYLDVSYINGTNVPMAVYPDGNKSALAKKEGDPFWCATSGGTSDTYKKIANNANSGFSCSYDYNLFKGDLRIFNFVDENGSEVKCTDDDNCSGGRVCGMSFKTLDGLDKTHQTPATTCGYRLGYHTYASICSVSHVFKYSEGDVSIDCNDSNIWSFSLCKADNNASAGNSCYNFNQTSPGDTCCGYADWTYGGEPIPSTMSPQVDVNRLFWYDEIAGALQYTKYACPISYAYQFDDPYATVTCSTELNGTNDNTASYYVEICPSGNQAGINPLGPVPSMPTNSVPFHEINNTIPAQKPVNQFLLVAALGDYIASVTHQGQSVKLSSPAIGAGGHITQGTVNAFDPGVYTVTVENASKYKNVCDITVELNGSITAEINGTICPNKPNVDTSGRKEISTTVTIYYGSVVSMASLPVPIGANYAVLSAPAELNVTHCTSVGGAYTCDQPVTLEMIGGHTAIDLTKVQGDFNLSFTYQSYNVSCYLDIPLTGSVTTLSDIAQMQLCYTTGGLSISDHNVSFPAPDGTNSVIVPATPANAFTMTSTVPFGLNDTGAVIDLVSTDVTMISKTGTGHIVLAPKTGLSDITITFAAPSAGDHNTTCAFTVGADGSLTRTSATCAPVTAISGSEATVAYPWF